MRELRESGSKEKEKGEDVLMYNGGQNGREKKEKKEKGNIWMKER